MEVLLGPHPERALGLVVVPGQHVAAAVLPERHREHQHGDRLAGAALRVDHGHLAQPAEVPPDHLDVLLYSFSYLPGAAGPGRRSPCRIAPAPMVATGSAGLASLRRANSSAVGVPSETQGTCWYGSTGGWRGPSSGSGLGTLVDPAAARGTLRMRLHRAWIDVGGKGRAAPETRTASEEPSAAEPRPGPSSAVSAGRVASAARAAPEDRAAPGLGLRLGSGLRLEDTGLRLGSRLRLRIQVSPEYRAAIGGQAAIARRAGRASRVPAGHRLAGLRPIDGAAAVRAIAVLPRSHPGYIGPLSLDQRIRRGRGRGRGSAGAKASAGHRCGRSRRRRRTPAAAQRLDIHIRRRRHRPVRRARRRRIRAAGSPSKRRGINGTG